MNVYLNGNLARMPVIHTDVLLTQKKKATLLLASRFFVSTISVCIFLLRGCEQSNSLNTTRC